MVAGKSRGKVKGMQAHVDDAPAPADEQWHGHLAHESQGRPGPDPESHGQDARDTHGRDAHATASAGAVEGLDALNVVNEKLSASSLRMAIVPISQCDLLEKNARFMRVEQYRRLVDNIKRDGCLTSVPFAIRSGDPSTHTTGSGQAGSGQVRYRILSGNHRVSAAKDAGLTEIPVLYTDRELTRQQQVAIQLSHNAIAGQDDLAILRELYDEINDVALKEYSGLDDVVLGKMEPPSLDPLSESALEYRIVSIAFLPDEVDRAEKLLAKVPSACYWTWRKSSWAANRKTSERRHRLTRRASESRSLTPVDDVFES
jgi:hypothetical protein